MTIEPFTGPVALTKSAIQTTHAAIQLSDSIVDRLQKRRIIQNAERNALRGWLQAQVESLVGEARALAAARIDTAQAEAMSVIWDNYALAVQRQPQAEGFHAARRDQSMARVLRSASVF